MASGAIPLREGVMPLMRQCRDAGVCMGIATTTSRSDLEALMRAHLGCEWMQWFGAVVCGEDVTQKKPDPEVYAQALRALDVGLLDAVAIEDAPGGVAAAQAAGIAVVVTRSAYFASAPIEGAIAVGPGLHQRRGWRPALEGDVDAGVSLSDIAARWSQRDSVSDYP